MGPDQEAVSHDDRVLLELAGLVLGDLLGQGLHGLVVRRALGHRPALRGRGQQLRAILHARGFAYVEAQELQRLDHDAVGRIILGALVITDEGHRHDEQQEKEEYAQYHQLVVFLQQKPRQADADLARLRAVRVAVLLEVLPGALVGQRGIRLSDLDEAGGCQGVVGVFVGVVNQRQLPVCLLDVGGTRRRRDFEDLERVKSVDFPLRRADAQVHEDQQGPDDEQNPGLSQQRPALAALVLLFRVHPHDHGGALACQHLLPLLAHRRGVAVRRPARAERAPCERQRPRDRDGYQQASREVVERGVVVAQQLLVLVPLGEGVAEGHG
mmetsp:Transcript_48422/g.147309  ORF Transcript_48422/g.147309 Transcript_48422/m.147309 type:complete len:326 (+) Transcript_48422:1164-2141(+)